MDEIKITDEEEFTVSTSEEIDENKHEALCSNRKWNMTTANWIKYSWTKNSGDENDDDFGVNNEFLKIKMNVDYVHKIKQFSTSKKSKKKATKKNTSEVKNEIIPKKKKEPKILTSNTENVDLYDFYHKKLMKLYYKSKMEDQKNEKKLTEIGNSIAMEKEKEANKKGLENIIEENDIDNDRPKIKLNQKTLVNVEVIKKHLYNGNNSNQSNELSKDIPEVLPKENISIDAINVKEDEEKKSNSKCDSVVFVETEKICKQNEDNDPLPMSRKLHYLLINGIKECDEANNELKKYIVKLIYKISNIKLQKSKVFVCERIDRNGKTVRPRYIILGTGSCFSKKLILERRAMFQKHKIKIKGIDDDHKWIKKLKNEA